MAKANVDSPLGQMFASLCIVYLFPGAIMPISQIVYGPTTFWEPQDKKDKARRTLNKNEILRAIINHLQRLPAQNIFTRKYANNGAEPTILSSREVPAEISLSLSSGQIGNIPSTSMVNSKGINLQN